MQSFSKKIGTKNLRLSKKISFSKKYFRKKCNLPASRPEELRDSERTYASTHAYLGTAGRGTPKGTVGCERAG